MRESNFTFPAHNRACVCISSSLYDRRALDAPAASLPLVNSLTHLSYLTATSARIRESLSSDGGLERLVRILQHCANPTAQSTRLSDLKGKGKELPKTTIRKARSSPFKAFSEYDLLPSLEELKDLQDLIPSASVVPLIPRGISSLSQSLNLPPSLKSRHLLYTYTLAFQCIVNIGVRGSESIRTRVVEAGALQVVVHVLERYLEEIERKRVNNQVEWQKVEQSRLAHLQLVQVQAMMEGGGGHSQPVDVEDTATTMEEEEASDDRTVVIVDTSSASDGDTITQPRPRLTRINIVAASSSAGVEALAPPSRVQTPDTILSNDDASLTGDDNGSSSGQETEEVTMSIVTTSEEAAARLPIKAEGSRSSNEGSQGGEAVTDDNGDITMSGPSSPVEERSEAEVDTTPLTTQPEREPTPRSTVQPNLLPAPTAIHRTPRATTISRHRGPPPPPPLPVPQNAPPTPTSTNTSAIEPSEGQLYFRDEDVLLALQLLAYLSKYPHVREVFHCPSSSSSSCCDTTVSPPTNRSGNIFSLVELFTHRPPSDDPFTPRLSNEVQYWACTIMRNACRKDEQRGGIRQCANMNCGKWEQYAREFAKCRRCRRAKYCSKACQSASWGNGHKFWCHKQSASSSSTSATATTATDEHRSSRTGRRTTTNEQDLAAAVDSTGVATPTNASPLPGIPPATRRRHRRTTGGGGGGGGVDEEEEDEDELPLPRPPQHVRNGSVATIRNRSATLTATTTTTTTAVTPAHHQHLLVQPTTLPGIMMEGQVEEGGMPVTIDEDQIAREMMSMGDHEGVRVQDA